MDAFFLMAEMIRRTEGMVSEYAERGLASIGGRVEQDLEAMRTVLALASRAQAAEARVGELTEALNTAEGGDWRPLGEPGEGVPWNGKSVLLICNSAYSPEADIGWWQSDGWRHYSRPEDKWHGGVGRWFPTHWQPLPAPLGRPSAIATQAALGPELVEALEGARKACLHNYSDEALTIIDAVLAKAKAVLG